MILNIFNGRFPYSRDFCFSALKKISKSAGAVFYIDARKPQGKLLSTLQPRTLPNGVQNGDYAQNVSNDIVFNGTETWVSYPPATTRNPDILCFYNSLPDQYLGHFRVACDKIPTTNSCWDASSVLSISSHDSLSRNYVVIEKSRLVSPDLNGFKAWMAENTPIIRYQLATPVDIINTPFKTNMTDVGYLDTAKNLFNPVVLTTSVVNPLPANIGYTVDADTITLTQIDALTYRYVAIKMTLEPNTLYSIRRDFTVISNGNGSTGMLNVYNDAITVQLGTMPSVGKSVSFTTPSDGKIAITLYTSSASASAASVKFYNIQIEKGAYSTAYYTYTALRAVTPKNELQYNPITWAEWTKNGVTCNVEGTRFFWSTTTRYSASMPVTAKPSTKYGMLCNLKLESIVNHGGIYAKFGDSSAQQLGIASDGARKLVITTPATINTNTCLFSDNGFGTAGGAGDILINNIRVFELPAGSQIEADFTNLTADQLNAKYPVDGNAYMANFAGTEGSGYVECPVIATTGAPISYANELTNGDFASGVTGWTAGNATISATGGIATITGDGGTNYPEIVKANDVPYVNGKRLAVRVKARVTGVGCTGIRVWIAATGMTVQATTLVTNPTQNAWYDETAVFTLPSGGSGIAQIRVQHSYADAATANGKVMEIDSVMVVDLSSNQGIKDLEAKLSRQLVSPECSRLFAFTATNSSVSVSVQPFLKFDGTDDYMAVFDPQLDIIGTADFAMSLSILMPPTVAASYVLAKGLDAGTNIQYGVYIVGDGSIYAYFNGVAVGGAVAGTLQPNQVYNISITRIAGRLKIKINDVEKLNQADVSSLTSQPNMRIGARPDTSNGTAMRYNGYLGYLAIMTGKNCTEANVDKFCKSARRGYM